MASESSVESRSTLLQRVKSFNTKVKTVYKKKFKDKYKGKVLTYNDLKRLSSNFSEDNYLGRTHFGVLYKGLIPENWKGYRSREVTIKMWRNELCVDRDVVEPHNPWFVRHSMEQELKFLQQPEIATLPSAVNVIGFCLEDDRSGFVYDLNPLRTLKKQIDKFAGQFGWLKRVNVAVKLASLLKSFHEHVPEYIVRNLSPAHVMLDQDLNPFLIDYAMMRGGSFVDVLPKQRAGPYGCRGYFCAQELMCVGVTRCNDVHAYGVILLEILRQCTYGNNREVKYEAYETEDFAWNDYVSYRKMQEENTDGGGAAGEDSLYSFAHESMKMDPYYDAQDGNKLSLLGLRCLYWDKVAGPPIRSMDQVLVGLKELNVVQNHPELFK